ncbi:hypothetical protein KJ840_04135 [Patescibacteria group bacterium]|nr:hypothetical protein [Patescibacteria group bacterium]
MLIWLVIFWRLPATANWITLHFNIYFGIDWIGSWIQIFIYPLISFIIIILNLVISWLIAGKSKSLALAVNYTSLLVQFIILTGLITLFIKYFV